MKKACIKSDAESSKIVASDLMQEKNATEGYHLEDDTQRGDTDIGS